MALVALNNLGRRSGGKWALWDVSLQLDAGEMLGVFGRCGSGKSTLARVLAGLDTPTSGSISLADHDGQSTFHMSVGFSSPGYAGELTVYENLDMFGRAWDVSAAKRTRDIAFLLEFMRLVDLRNARASSISEGALRRLEIARALLADSPVTVFDCLLDSLDSDILEKLWDYLLELRRNESKSFVVLTSSNRIAEMCQRLAVIHKGRVVFIGRPEDFRRLAGEDVVVLGDVCSPLLKNRIQEQFSVVIKEEDGFLSFKVGSGERMVSDLLAEFGSDLGCVYLKRPTLEDALDVLADGASVVAAGARE